MALFLRRETQRRLTEAATFIERGKLESLAKRLNDWSKVSLEAQWELMWLTALARTGTLQHEAQHAGGTTFPDVHYRSGDLEFVADITTASDQGLENENPMDEFRRALNRFYRKHRMDRGFFLKVDSKMVGEYRDKKVKLALPPRSDLDNFIRTHFESIIVAAKTHPSISHRHAVALEGGLLTLDYDPSRKLNQESGHLTFTVFYSLERNPIFNALNAKKRQLRKSGFVGLKGILLCDASCRMLSASFQNGSSYSLADVILGFLRKTKAVDFVLTVGVQQNHAVFGPTTVSLKPQLFCQPRMSDQTMHLLEKELSRGLRQLPQPDAAGYQALSRLERKLSQNPLFSAASTVVTGGFNMDHEEIRLSNRVLTAFLAGKISPQEFQETHELSGNTGEQPLNLLRRWFEEGRLIIETKLIRLEHEDDDHVLLRFGPPDPAASRFKIPTSNPEEAR